MFLNILQIVLSQVPTDPTHSGSMWTSPNAVYGGITLVVALLLWSVRQAFYIWTIKRDSEEFRTAMIGNQATGAIGLVQTLKSKVSELEANGLERTARLEKIAHAIDTRPWCDARRKEVDLRFQEIQNVLGHLPSKESINDAFTEIRGLKDVVAEERMANREALAEIRGTVNQILALLQSGIPAAPMTRQRTGPLPGKDR